MNDPMPTTRTPINSRLFAVVLAFFLILQGPVAMAITCGAQSSDLTMQQDSLVADTSECHSVKNKSSDTNADVASADCCEGECQCVTALPSINEASQDTIIAIVDKHIAQCVVTVASLKIDATNPPPIS